MQQQFVHYLFETQGGLCRFDFMFDLCQILILRLNRGTCSLLIQETFRQLRFLSFRLLDRKHRLLGEWEIEVIYRVVFTNLGNKSCLFRSRERATAEVRTFLESLSISRSTLIFRLAWEQLSCCFLIYCVNWDRVRAELSHETISLISLRSLLWVEVCKEGLEKLWVGTHSLLNFLTQ